MSTRAYRAAVVGCMLAWFLLGMHAPVLHRISAHGHTPRAPLLAALVVLAVAAMVGVWTLWRYPRHTAAT